MPQRIEITSKVPDARSVSRRGFFNSLSLSKKVTNVKIIDSYTIDARLNKSQIQKACAMLTNPIIETAAPQATHYPLHATHFDYAIEISFLPGVTDNVGNTARETIADGTKYKFKDSEKVYSSQVQLLSFHSKPALDDIKKIVDSLYNPLIQKVQVKSFAEYKKDGGFGLNLPKVKLTSSNKVLKVDLNISDNELKDLGKLGIQENTTRRGPLALDLDQLKTIRNYFNKLGRQPTDVELECLGQTWSEHCKHIIFTSPIDDIKDGLYKHYIKRATQTIREKNDFCVSVFSDNAGAVIFDEDFLITHKVETHNTPSALDPFGGAITGIVGVNRDALGFGLGAKPVINTYGFCLSAPDDNSELYRDSSLKNKMLSARRIMDGVIAGVNAGGNQSGIPTNSGFLFFDKRYRGKPLVFAGTVGLIPRLIDNKPSHIKQALSNDLIVMVGGRVGLDGIHGATFSSEGLDENSPATAVQIGDPITQKKFTDAIVREARGLYNSITDCGAGGLSSAVGEMATQSGGCEVKLETVLVKYPGLAPWQIWISESQERMVLAVPKKNWKKFHRLMQKRGVESSVIGKFTSSGKCLAKFGKQTVMNIDLEFLHDGMEKRKLQTKSPVTKSVTPNINRDFLILNPKSLILNLLSSPNITSTAFLVAQYDHEVQAGSVLKPLQGAGRVNANATVTRPVLTSQKGVVLSSALYPEYSETDPYNMAACTIDSAIAAAVSVGANPDYLALLDNFCWCSPEDPERLWQLKQAAKACFDYAVAFGTPFISGKDSMYNDFKGFGADGKPIKISIPPTLLISAIGVINDVTKSISLDAKMPGDIIYLLGNPLNDAGLNVPKVDAIKNLKLYHAFYQASQKNIFASALSVGRGGIAIALSKMAIGGQLGISVNCNKMEIFSHQPGLIVATVSPKNTSEFEKALAGNPFTRIGTIQKAPLINITAGKEKISLPLAQATKAYHSTFKNF